MRIAVKANPAQQQEWQSKKTNADVEIIWVENGQPEADAYFDLTYEDFGPAFTDTGDKPLLVNAVINTLAQLPANAARFNGWDGFLKRDLLEIAGNGAAVNNVLQQLGWRYQTVPDVPGFISARTIAMIINEAYFAIGDEVSSREEIDLAMKLGTNYPFGPFEWSRAIGLHRVYRLLKHLSESDSRYMPAPALEQELKTIA